MQKKFTAYEKLSKSEKRKIDKKRRVVWDTLNPVTRRVDSKKLYNRKRTPYKNDDFSTGLDFFAYISQ